MPRRISDEEYRRRFAGDATSLPLDGAAAKALERALDIRKFEIDLYWKRAAYFWTFIGATLAGFVAIQASSSSNKDDLSVILCNLGFTFSFGWLCVNRASKQWQENWENHVDMLEDRVQGPLYKVVLKRTAPKGVRQLSSHILTGPSSISVSKVNQLISLFVTLIWFVLLLYSLPQISTHSPIDWYYVSFIGLSGLACIGFLTVGRTNTCDNLISGTVRTTSINDEMDKPQ
jgi:hypothetical protein